MEEVVRHVQVEVLNRVRAALMTQEDICGFLNSLPAPPRVAPPAPALAAFPSANVVVPAPLSPATARSPALVSAPTTVSARASPALVSTPSTPFPTAVVPSQAGLNVPASTKSVSPAVVAQTAPPRSRRRTS